MSWMQIGAAVAAAAVGLWPQLKNVVPKVTGGPSYQDAMKNLAVVRLRLLETQTLKEQEKDAIDTLTLALVAGSDK